MFKRFYEVNIDPPSGMSVVVISKHLSIQFYGGSAPYGIVAYVIQMIFAPLAVRRSEIEHYS